MACVGVTASFLGGAAAVSAATQPNRGGQGIVTAHYKTEADSSSNRAGKVEAVAATGRRELVVGSAAAVAAAAAAFSAEGSAKANGLIPSNKEESATAAEQRHRVIKVGAVRGEINEIGSDIRGIINAAIQLTKGPVNGMEMEVVELGDLPMLNPDDANKVDLPPAVVAFRDKIKKFDSILFCTPEYNYSISGALKNALDWGSYPENLWCNKTAGVVSTGYDVGGARAQYHLRQIGVPLDINFENEVELFVSICPPLKFDEEGNLTDARVTSKLQSLLVALREFSLKMPADRTKNCPPPPYLCDALVD